MTKSPYKIPDGYTCGDCALFESCEGRHMAEPHRSVVSKYRWCKFRPSLFTPRPQESQS